MDYGKKLPIKVQQIFVSAQVEADARQRKIMWEVNRVRRALFGFEDKVILVKGGGLYRQKAELF